MSSRNRHSSRAARGCAFALALVAVVACGRAPAGPADAPPAAEVTVTTLEARTVELPFAVPGRLQGSREVEVRSRVKGILQAWTYRVGAPVAAGQLLFRIDPASYQAAVDRARGQVGESEARLARAERDVARLAPLADREAVSRRELDDAVSERDLAAAALESARAALRSTELELGYTRVTAPVAGMSGRALRSQGSLVDDGDNSLLTVISRLDPIWALFTLSDRDLARLQGELTRAGKAISSVEAELVTADGRVHPRRGRINFSGSQVDSATGSVELRAEFDNADSALLPGSFVRVVLRGVERVDTLVVPQRAVQQGPQGRFVWVVGSGDVAESRPVELESWDGSDWIVTQGLSAGERVIVDGALKVGPGTPVRIAEPAAGEAGS